MQQESQRKLRFYYGIALSVLTVVLAVWFIAETADLYYSGLASGGEIYSRAIVGVRLRRLAIPSVLWILSIIGGFVFSVLFPVAKKGRVKQNAGTALRKLKRRMPNAQGEEFLAEKNNFTRLERSRYILYAVAALFSLASAIVTIVYLSNTGHFAAVNLNAEILAMVKGVMPWIGVSLLLFVAATLYEHFTVKREIESMKKLLLLGRGAPVEQPSALLQKYRAGMAVVESEKTKWVVRGVVLAVGLTFFIVGICNGGANDVLFKAINICTECIGLG